MEKKTNLERLVTTLKRKVPDRVPYCLLLLSASRRIAGVSYKDFSTNAEACAKSFLAGSDFIGGQALIPLTDLSVEAADFGQKVLYPEDSTPYPDYTDALIKDVSDYRKLKRIDLKNAPRMQNMLATLRILVEKAGNAVGGWCYGPLGVLNMMRGADHLFRDCALYPSEVMAALETITDGLIQYVEAQIDLGISSVCFDTLFASWNGLSKRLWERIEGPFARELANAVRRKGGRVLVHNCGHGIYFDSQIRFMEPSVINFAHLPDDCSDRKELKRRYGGQVVLMGYIPTPLLSHGTPFEVMEECKRQIEDLAPGGGYILAPGCEFPPNAPLENAMAIVRAAELYG